MSLSGAVKQMEEVFAAIRVEQIAPMTDDETSPN
jgi:hypothetical protein